MHKRCKIKCDALDDDVRGLRATILRTSENVNNRRKRGGAGGQLRKKTPKTTASDHRYSTSKHAMYRVYSLKTVEWFCCVCDVAVALSLSLPLYLSWIVVGLSLWLKRVFVIVAYWTDFTERMIHTLLHTDGGGRVLLLAFVFSLLCVFSFCYFIFFTSLLLYNTFVVCAFVCLHFLKNKSEKKKQACLKRWLLHSRCDQCCRVLRFFSLSRPV